MSAQVPAWEVEVFYDGDCPLCMREIRMLMRRDRDGRIRFTNLTDPSFDPSTLGLSHETMMKKIHGRLPSGQLIEGVEVFRRLYDAVGFSWLVQMTRWPVIAPLLDAGYTLFAKNRLRLTGRCDAESCAVPPRSRVEA
jgi:predicted DCC family thiol-disulfide oxidoreductase YuxK